MSHVGQPGLPDAGDPGCCWGTTMDGPEYCTCWIPVYAKRSQPLPPSDLVVREARCPDCAFRPDSPERSDGTLDRLTQAAVEHPDRPFFCHQGLTPVIEYRHPSGVTYRPEDLPSAQGKPPMDYDPLLNSAGRPCRDDGTQQDVCAGWAAATRRARRAW